MGEIIVLCAEETQQIESQIVEAQGKKNQKTKPKPLQMKIQVFSPTYWVKYLLISSFLHFRLFPLRLTMSCPCETLPLCLVYLFPPAAAQAASNEHPSPRDPRAFWSIRGNSIYERHCGFLPWKCLQHYIQQNYDFYKEGEKNNPDRIWGTSVYMNTLRISSLSMRTVNI